MQAKLHVLRKLVLDACAQCLERVQDIDIVGMFKLARSGATVSAVVRVRSDAKNPLPMFFDRTDVPGTKRKLAWEISHFATWPVARVAGKCATGHHHIEAPPLSEAFHSAMSS